MISGRRVSRLRVSTAWIVLALLTGCASADDSGRSSGASPSPTAEAGSKTTASAVVCNGDNELNQDDDGALQALLQRAQLPPGTWTTARTPRCPWALSADELLVVAECRAAAEAADAPPNDEVRNGNARVTFTRADDVQLDDRIEIYTSRQNVDAIRAILAGPSMPACFTAALVQRAREEPATTIRDVRVSSFAVQPDAAALGLGFPAVAGYAADTGFAEGVDVTFTRTTKGSSVPVAMRVVTFGSGGLMSTVTLIGATPAELDAIDFTATLRAAAENYLAITDPKR